MACRMSNWLRTIPAKESESSAIMAMDPISLIELGLHDADKALLLEPKNPKAFLQQVKLICLPITVRRKAMTRLHHKLLYNAI